LSKSENRRRLCESAYIYGRRQEQRQLQRHHDLGRAVRGGDYSGGGGIRLQLHQEAKTTIGRFGTSRERLNQEKLPELGQSGQRTGKETADWREQRRRDGGHEKGKSCTGRPKCGKHNE
jgi:hypothetical protein